jgi:hypothetical protein
MAGKNSDNTISSVSDIFGFLLKQSENPPLKKTPTQKQTGEVQADSEYVSALVDTVAVPTAFIGEQTLGVFQDLLDNEVKIDTFKGRPGPDFFKLKFSTIPDLVSDPGGTIDKMFKKARDTTKQARIQWAGEQMRMMVGSAYAKKSKLFDDYDKDMENILIRAVGQSAMESPNINDTVWVQDAARKIIDNGNIKTELDGLKEDLNKTANPNQKREIQKKIDEIATITNNKEKSLNPERGPSQLYPDFRTILKAEFDGHKREILQGREEKDLSQKEYDQYKKMEMASRTMSLWNEFNAKDDKRVSPLNKRKFAQVKKRLEENRKNLISQREAIRGKRTYTLDGNTVDYSQYTDQQRSRELNNIKQQIKVLGDNSGRFNRMQFWSKLGGLEGTYYGIKATLGPGGVEAMLKGDFFNPAYGFFGCPSEKQKYKLSDKKITGAEGKEEAYVIEFYKANHRVRNENKQTKYDVKPMGQRYNDAMMTLHYANPITWAKTLTTGEGFAWLADKRRDKLYDIGSIDNEAQRVFTHLRDQKFWTFYMKWKKGSPQERTALLKSNPNYSALISKITLGLRNQNSDFAKKFKKAEKLMGQFKGYEKLATIFSTPKRVTDSIKNQIFNQHINKFRRNVRDKVVASLSKMKMFAKDEAAKAMLKSWQVTGGKALAGAISKAVVGALGLAGSTLAGPVGAAVTFLTSEILETILKTVLKITLYVGMGSIVLVFFFAVFIKGGIGSFKKQSKIDAYSREYPGTIYYNESFTGVGDSESLGANRNNPFVDTDGDGIPDTYLVDTDGDGVPDSYLADTDGDGVPDSYVAYNYDDGPDIIPPRSNEECIVGSGYKACTQGWGGPPCFSHTNILSLKPVDLVSISFIYTPQFCGDPGSECVIQNSAPFFCSGSVPGGGQVWFSASDGTNTYKFHFVHTILVNGYSPGDNITVGGEPFAYVQQDLTSNSCWTGPHLHLETQQNGSYVDPLKLLQAFNCNVPDLSGCTNCTGYSNTRQLR